MNCNLHRTAFGFDETLPAFTLVEVLTTVAIIAILMAISVMGLKTLNRNARNQATHSALEQCRSMVAEFETFNSANGWVTALASSYGQNVTTSTATAPSGIVDVNLGSSDPGLLATEAVMAQMAATCPAIRQMMDRIPPAHFFVNSSGTRTHILVDGWGTPILFVPGGGLSGVSTGGQTVTIHGPDFANGKGHPFFASAGEDTKFTGGNGNEGDDNIYSFMAN